MTIWKYIGLTFLAWLPVITMVNLFWNPPFWQVLLIIFGVVWYRGVADVAYTYFKDAMKELLND
jgi:predicted membrane channel-forming protein YqfA (hemolysin III family)